MRMTADCDSQAGRTDTTLAVKHTERINACGEAVSLGIAEHASMKQEPGNPGCWIDPTTEELTEPLALPPPMKASAMVRALPADRQCRHALKIQGVGMPTHWCAFGWLAEHTPGVEWMPANDYTCRLRLDAENLSFVGAVWDLTPCEMAHLEYTFDHRGRDATANLLESWGK